MPSCWAGAIPSSYVTRDAFERIAGAICEDAVAARDQGGLDAIYLDLHGAAVAEHADDSEGELLARLRRLVGPALPIVASLDLHANVTRRMLRQADALVAYRTYPHVDMAETGERAAGLLARRLAAGTREPMQRAPAAVPDPAERAEHLARAGQAPLRRAGSARPRPRHRAQLLHGLSRFRLRRMRADGLEPRRARRAGGEPLCRPRRRSGGLAARDPAGARRRWSGRWRWPRPRRRPVVVADTQDNPGAGGDSNTTGMLHALLAQGAGRRFPGQVALGLMFDPAAARAALEAGVGAELDLALGTAVPTFTGQASDPPVRGRFKVLAVADGVCTLTGPMMHGLTVRLGPSACLEIDGIRIAVVSGKKQLLDRALLRMVGIHAEQMRIIVVKSSNHFRADFQPIACRVLIAKAAGPMAADPAELPWKKLPATIRRRP